jgi:hypothetical protein
VKDPVQLSEDLNDKICDVLNGEGELVSKWIAVAEIIDSDGRRWLRTFWPDGGTDWDNIGMLSYALDDINTPIWLVEDDTEGDTE